MRIVVDQQDSCTRNSVVFHRGPNERNRAVTRLSTLLHTHEKTANRVLDYSTDLGAVYPAFAKMVYLIGLPPITIFSGSPEASTSCTVSFRNFPSCAWLVGE